MIVDPDHLSVRARKEVMTVLEAERYSGVVSSHSWSTPDALPRIYDLGGVVAPYAGNSNTFVKAWRDTKPMRNRSYYFGFGYGADMNGFGAQGGPRPGGNVPTRSSRSTARSRSTVSAAASGSTTSTRTAWPTTGCTRTGSRTCASRPAARS